MQRRLRQREVFVRQVEREEVDFPFNPADLRQRLAKVDLRMPRIMAKRHKHLPLPQPALVYAILHDRQPAGEAVLVPRRSRSAWKCAAASPDASYPPPGSGR